MTHDLKEAQVDKWLAEYKPIANTISDTSGWEVNGTGILFETFGEELQFIQNQPNENVWTWVDGDEGTSIVTGMAFVNRIGYFVTSKAWTDISEVIEVDTYGDEEDE